MYEQFDRPIIDPPGRGVNGENRSRMHQGGLWIFALTGEHFGGLSDAIQTRMNQKRVSIGIQGLPKFTEVGMTMSQPAPRAKVHRHPLDHTPAIADRRGEILHEITCQCPLVVGFGEIFIGGDGGVEMFQGVGQITGIQGGGTGLQMPVRLLVTATKPDRPERMFGHLHDDRIGIMQQRRKFLTTRLIPHQSQRKGGYFFGIAAAPFKKTLKLRAAPVLLQRIKKSRNIPFFQQRMQRRDKVFGIRHILHGGQL